jgi:hypothetical protein
VVCGQAINRYVAGSRATGRQPTVRHSAGRHVAGRIVTRRQVKLLKDIDIHAAEREQCPPLLL